MRALDIARTGADRDAVTAALRAVYLPWLNAGAVGVAEARRGRQGAVCRASQTAGAAQARGLALRRRPSPGSGATTWSAAPGEGRHGHVGCTWSGFPTIKATCKGLASPAASLLAAASADGLVACLEGKPAQ